MESNKKSLGQWLLLILNCVALFIGGASGNWLIRFYFLHGGNRIWFAAWLQTAACPLLILPIWLSSRTKQTSESESTHVTPMLCLASVIIGLLTGLDNFLYSWGLSYLPLSTSSLVIGPQPAFNALFAFFLVKQKFTAYSINAIILLTMGSVMLVFNTNGDRPKGVTSRQYWIGFLAAGGAAALYGVILPLIELLYKKTRRRITYTLVMEIQLIVSLSASVVCTVGMVVNKDFSAVGREAMESDVGKFNYYMAVVWSAVCWQLFFDGLYCVIFLTSSLWSAVLMTCLTPVAEVLAVVIFKEKFTGEKGMSLAMSLWGFTSYFYGEYKKVGISNDEHRQVCESASVKYEAPTLELAVDEPTRSNNTA